MVNASKPAVRQLTPFAVELRQLAQASIPTLAELSDLIRNPSGAGDLLTLLRDTPGLAKVAIARVPAADPRDQHSQEQLDALREYTPDVVAALTNLGQAGAYYDANGHYVRTQPIFDAFAVDGANELEPLPAQRSRYTGLEVVHGRCPGCAVQPTADGSAPWAGPGLQLDSGASGAMRRIAAIAAVLVGALVAVGAGASSSSSKTPTYLVRAIFDNASFAVSGEDVRIAGANVGSIQGAGGDQAEPGGGHARDHESRVHPVPSRTRPARSGRSR